MYVAIFAKQLMLFYWIQSQIPDLQQEGAGDNNNDL
jgi:hypothetical protein